MPSGYSARPGSSTSMMYGHVLVSEEQTSSDGTYFGLFEETLF